MVVVGGWLVVVGGGWWLVVGGWWWEVGGGWWWEVGGEWWVGVVVDVHCLLVYVMSYVILCVKVYFFFLFSKCLNMNEQCKLVYNHIYIYIYIERERT